MSQQASYRGMAGQMELPVFAQPWWLDAVAEGQWDAVIGHDDKGNITATWAFGLKEVAGMKRIFMPPLTPYLGPVLFYPKRLNEYERRSFEHKAITTLIRQLPDARDIRFKWQPHQDNWLPFYWKGFEQTTRYTYIIRDTGDADKVFDHFKDSIQRQIRKAEKGLKAHWADNSENAVAMFRKSLAKNGAPMDYGDNLFQRMDAAASAHSCRAILEAKDESGNMHAAIYVVWDGGMMHYLYGGMDERFSDSGAMPLLFWKAIQLASEKGLPFNFEGSMLQGVERFFRSFGGALTPVFFIYKRRFPFNLIAI